MLNSKIFFPLTLLIVVYNHYYYLVPLVSCSSYVMASIHLRIAIIEVCKRYDTSALHVTYISRFVRL